MLNIYFITFFSGSNSRPKIAEYSFAKTVGIPVVQESKYNILYGNKQLSLLEKNQEINLTELNKNLENPSKK